MRGQISQEDWKSSFIYTDIAIISVFGIKYFGRMMGNAYQKKKMTKEYLNKHSKQILEWILFSPI